MPRPKSEFDVQTALRIPRAWLERADALRAHVSKDGLNVTRTDVLRVALVAGLAKLEAERAESKAETEKERPTRKLR